MEATATEELSGRDLDAAVAVAIGTHCWYECPSLVWGKMRGCLTSAEVADGNTDLVPATDTEAYQTPHALDSVPHFSSDPAAAVALLAMCAAKGWIWETDGGRFTSCFILVPSEGASNGPHDRFHAEVHGIDTAAYCLAVSRAVLVALQAEAKEANE